MGDNSPNRDIVFIRDLEVEAVIGVFDWERRVKQRLVFDVEMATNIVKAAKTDNLEYAINYRAVADELIEFVSHSEFQLIESLVEHLSMKLNEKFGLSWVRLTVHKPGAVKEARDVGVVIERTFSSPMDDQGRLF
ncbi:dihydroneopterin aldolase [Marinibactrum halimedae]|uniref:7,8-dihydroneopterin aldolase n=1 Tax=Marinibactrum halimedae TaxID=1444977 RepID=A0AA37T6L5_9GAMM|nr:dihydroneopterin aldolase [Marinibactrum halimedae]MCD9459546.1 dihydroneopterin aldolase [Marinibactrum halimedae]GLS25637.1 7,8-dihydroneopterin aldolase [Marinibactrum halimedae]